MSKLSTQLASLRFFSDFKSDLLRKFTSWAYSVMGKQNWMRNRRPEDFFDSNFVNWFFVSLANGDSCDMIVMEGPFVIQADLNYFFAKYGLTEFPLWPTEIEDEIIAGYKQKLRGIKYNAVVKDFTFGVEKMKRALFINQRRRAFLISFNQFARIKDRYTGTNFEEDLACLMMNYDALGINSNFMGLPPSLLNSESFGTDKPLFELFGSPFNTNGAFCGAFGDERKFGSHGSFFDYEFSDQYFYFCNPPYSEIILAMAAQRIVSELKRSEKMIEIVMVMPIWDAETQKKLGIPVAKGTENNRYEALEILRASNLIREHVPTHRDKIKYYNYFTEGLITVSNSHVLYISNQPSGFKLSNFLQRWTLY